MRAIKPQSLIKFRHLFIYWFTMFNFVIVVVIEMTALCLALESTATGPFLVFEIALPKTGMNVTTLSFVCACLPFFFVGLNPPAAVANEGNDMEKRQKEKRPFWLNVVFVVCLIFTTIWTFQSLVEGQKDWEIPKLKRQTKLEIKTRKGEERETVRRERERGQTHMECYDA